MFIALLSSCKIGSFDESLDSNSWGSIKCLTLNNRYCWARATLIIINSYKINYYSFTISDNKCEGNSNTTDDPYTWVCAPNKVKYINVLN